MQCIVKGKIYFTFYYTLHKKGDDIVAKLADWVYEDRATIYAALDKIDEYAMDYTSMAAAIKKAANYFVYDNLEVEGRTMEQPVIDVGDFVTGVEKRINKYTSNVKTSVQELIDQLEAQANDEQNTGQQQSN
jgi:uroporphyrinogen-III decarboxylase